MKAVPANILMDRELNLDEPLGTVYDDMTELFINNCKNPCHLSPREISLQTTAKCELPKQFTVNIVVNLSAQ